ncbi:MAG: ribonuclease III [Pseudomonadota bacterium]
MSGPADDAEARAVERAVGHEFKDRALLERALTHSSLSADAVDLERLEFLGDRVLGLMAAETLWRRWPTAPEGELAPKLNALVRKETCADAARALGVPEALRLAPAEAAAGGRDKTTILGDACEALLGALFIDGGLPAARGAFDAFWTPALEELTARDKDPKTALQEWSQDRRRGAPTYAVIERTGPDHGPTFIIEVAVPGFAVARGVGSSKRAAQMNAAEAFLVREGVWEDG